MTDKAQFCHNALIDQIEQWQKSLEDDLKIMKQIKDIALSSEVSPITERMWVNKNVGNIIEDILYELQAYKNERNQIMKGASEFLSIIKRYEVLSANFQKINQDIRQVYSYSQEFYNLKQEQQKNKLLDGFYSQIKESQQKNQSVEDRYQLLQTENLNYRDEERQESDDDEQDGKYPQSQVSFLNDTFNSIQNRQISQQKIEDIKNKSMKKINKSSINVQQNQPSKSILKEKKMIEFAENIKSDWFGDLQKAYMLTGGDNNKNCSMTTSKTAKFQQKENPNQSKLMERSKNSIQKRISNSQGRHEDRQNMTLQKSQLNYSFRQKQEENSSAFYILKRELLRIKELVQEQVQHYDNHHHNNIDEEIKKYKLENTLMRTQCQILKDENKELLVEFQKTKKILEDQIMLSKEIQDKLLEQQSISHNQQYENDQIQYYDNQINEVQQNENYSEMIFQQKNNNIDINQKSTNRIINQQIEDHLNEEEMLSSWVKKRVSNSNNQDCNSDN